MAAGLGESMVQVLTAAGRGSLPSPCTEMTPWGTLSMLQVSGRMPLATWLLPFSQPASRQRPQVTAKATCSVVASCYAHLMMSIICMAMYGLVIEFAAFGWEARSPTS